MKANSRSYGRLEPYRPLYNPPNQAYSFTVIAKSITGFRTPFVPRAQALTRRAFFMPAIYGGLYGATFG
jgi:hypothetical protein